MNTMRFLTTPRISFTALVLSTMLVACDNSGSVAPDATPPGQPGNNPATSLTFSQQSGGHAQPGDSTLRSTMAAVGGNTLSFNELQTLVFGPMCSGCHTGGGISQPSVFDFTDADGTYATLVNQSSTATPSATLVIPGNSANSHLMASLQGTAATGSRMPMRAAPVSDELLSSIRAWIDSGASR